MTHGIIDIAAPALQVLVVDDSQAMRTRVRWALEEAGLTVVGEAEDGAQALTQAAAHHPDVVLMELRMPRMDGVQATRILRRGSRASRPAHLERRRRPARSGRVHLGSTGRHPQAHRHGAAGRHLTRSLRCPRRRPDGRRWPPRRPTRCIR